MQKSMCIGCSRYVDMCDIKKRLTSCKALWRARRSRGGGREGNRDRRTINKQHLLSKKHLFPSLFSILKGRPVF
jgi:hypothetical protein